ncbi:aromatase/cyclase [Nonomuraea sp. NPDC048826]|uniref:aromatase/cyclase n=1 Tax=Nonomuraea sp. NPDC048826 TaxID=3364347 RepID=UPI003719F0B7
MATSAIHQTEHQITVAAEPAAVYAVLADAGAWPAVFPPTVHVDVLAHDDRQERIRIWATANGKPKSWTSRREFDRDRWRIRFRQEVSAHPVAAMGGEWIVEPDDDGSTRVRLTHDFRAVGGDSASVSWITNAVNRNSEAELAALRRAVETPGRLMAFEDSVRVRGDAADAYAFLYRSDLWHERLTHVAAITVTEETPGLQAMDMETRSRDGSTHTTSSVRVCFPEHLIVYKQLRTPPLLSLHAGRWTVRPDGDGAVVTSAHTVAIADGAVTAVLGPDGTVAQARDLARKALSGNSMLTLSAAKEYAESRRRTASV